MYRRDVITENAPIALPFDHHHEGQCDYVGHCAHQRQRQNHAVHVLLGRGHLNDAMVITKAK